MKTASISNSTNHVSALSLPRWIAVPGGASLEATVFSSGAALATLDIALRGGDPLLPQALLGERLALEAAVACVKLEGRNDSALQMRDAVCLARTEDGAGPAGDMFNRWRKLARINLRTAGWREQVMRLLPDAAELEAPNVTGAAQSPLSQAAHVLCHILQAYPREETAALMVADVTLARALGWDRALPLLAQHLKRSDVRAIAQGAENPVLRVHHAGISACDRTLRTIADLTRRAGLLHGVAPKLRAKGAAKAVALFLSHDAVSPSVMLSPVIKGSSVAMTDRAARRLCDRLVDLGAVRELTGRGTFRLYGV